MLEIKSLDEQHNHETNKELFRNLWQQRKLVDEEKENIRQMLDMKANKKIIQSNIMQATGKVVLMKDILNMKVTNNKESDLTTLQKAVNELTKVNGAFVKLQTDNKMENPELTGLFYQDERMRQVQSPRQNIGIVRHAALVLICKNEKNMECFGQLRLQDYS